MKNKIMYRVFLVQNCNHINRLYIGIYSYAQLDNFIITEGYHIQAFRVCDYD